MKKARVIPKIIVDHGMKSRIARQHGCSNEVVRRALLYITNNELAVAIRRDAMKHYGGHEVTIPVR